MSVGFAPVQKEHYPKWGTPPINPTNEEMNRSRDLLVKLVEEKSPFLANVLLMPVGCDMPEQGGITGTLGKKPPRGVMYLA